MFDLRKEIRLALARKLNETGDAYEVSLTKKDIPAGDKLYIVVSKKDSTASAGIPFDQVREWYFSRIRGKWCLRSIHVKDMSETPDYEFLQFYNKFATDTLHQESYLAQYVTFKGPDPDEDFSTMEGDIMREQWPMFKPWLPENEFYCIRYGKKNNIASDKRYFFIRGISNGIQTDLVFIRKGKTWELIKVEA